MLLHILAGELSPLFSVGYEKRVSALPEQPQYRTAGAIVGADAAGRLSRLQRKRIAVLFYKISEKNVSLLQIYGT